DAIDRTAFLKDATTRSAIYAKTDPYRGMVSAVPVNLTVSGLKPVFTGNKSKTPAPVKAVPMQTLKKAKVSVTNNASEIYKAVPATTTLSKAEITRIFKAAGTQAKNEYIKKFGRLSYYLKPNDRKTWISTRQVEIFQKNLEKRRAAEAALDHYTKYKVSLNSALKSQMSKNPQTQRNGRWVSANEQEVLKYLNPSNYKEDVYKYQFLDLSASAGIKETEMTDFLKGKGILSSYAAAYLRAAKEHSVSEVYLAAHSALETGNGTSVLARGVKVNGVTVYNMYGIGAYDGDAINSGANYAYKMGWDSPEKAITGGAKWISERYINNANYQQNTLYSMRWNPSSPGHHQYATDIGWAVKQTHAIKKMYDGFSNPILKFDILKYS
ncbi:hypothetical protein HOG48_03000, partial [Candidatus Peregrinibacteria bacterium]|nr:hypothetical protein [Candidatus Peregrinibacteria bacterium]